MANRCGLALAATVLCSIAACRERIEGPLVGRGVLRPQFYTSQPIRVTVVDEDGTPVMGAGVAAVWRNIYGFDERMMKVFLVFAVTTDEKGQFTIPRWGPRPPEHDHYLDKRDPELYIIKKGHRFVYADNEGMQMPLGDPPLKKVPRFVETRLGEYARTAEGFCRWNGEVITLPRARNEFEASGSVEAALPMHLGNMALRMADPWWEKWAEAWLALSPESRNRIAVPTPAKPFMSSSLDTSTIPK